MARTNFKPCRYKGCASLATRGHNYCEEHKALAEEADREKQRIYNEKRGSAASRGYNSRWQKQSKLYIHEQPLCVDCLKHNRVRPAKVVDHIVPHKGDMRLFWDRTNWQSLCFSCHSRKTACEDGGFGHRVKG